VTPAASEDPVEEALDRAAAGLSAQDADRFRSLMRTGLSYFEPVVGPEDQAIEVAAVADVPKDQLLAAAARFAAERRAFALGKRSLALLQAFSHGDDVRADARDLLDEVLAALESEADEGVRHELGSYALECRYVLSGGTGPNSLRGAKVSR
jgi:hypothetical protein